MMPQTCSVRALCVGISVLVVWATALASPQVGAAEAEADTVHAVAIHVRGPVALVEVTRALSPAPGGRSDAAEALIDLTLPPKAALLSVAVNGPGETSQWRSLGNADTTAARAAYADALHARGLTAVTESAEDGITDRVRVVWTVEPHQTGPLLRYRFAALLEPEGPRLRLRFSASSELSPQPAAVTVDALEASDLALPGQRIAGSPHKSTIRGKGQAPARAAWEVSYLPRPTGDAQSAATSARNLLGGTAATARLPGGEHALAVVAAAGTGPRSEAPTSVLFLIDRSRSVGLPGLSAERDVARLLLESLPPDTLFDVLFFDRDVKSLFAAPRSATGETLAALDSEMVPERLANGTDLPLALRAAGDRLRHATPALAPRALLVIITDGAFPDAAPGDDLDRTLGAVPGLQLSIATLLVRADDDESAPVLARAALQKLVAARGGIQRDINAGQIPDGLRDALDALARGGDLFGVTVVNGDGHRTLSERLGPGDGAGAVERWPAGKPNEVTLRARQRGGGVTTSLSPVVVPSAWLQSLVEKKTAAQPWFFSAAGVTALAQAVTPAPPAATADDGRGTLDRAVVQNTLALAFIPRARACYQNRSAPTAAERDLTGRVRLAIDLIRGEVAAAHIESSTLASPVVESCLRESAYALDVPRAARSDAPVTAVVNLVFRPRPPEKVHTAEDTFPISNDIDLALEELRKFEQARAPESSNSR